MILMMSLISILYSVYHCELKQVPWRGYEVSECFLVFILKRITRSRRRALRQRRQLQHFVSSVGVFSAAAIEIRAAGPETDRRVSQGAEAAASWLSPVGSRRSSMDGRASVRATPRDESTLGNRRSCINSVTSVLRRYYAAFPTRSRITYCARSVSLSVRLSRLRL